MLWIPEFPVLPEIKQEEKEEEEEEKEEDSEEEDEVEEVGVDHPFQNLDPVEVTVEEVEVSPELKVDQSTMKEQGPKHPCVTEEESPKKQNEMFATDDHSSGCADRRLVQLLPWQSSGSEEKRTTKEKEHCRCLYVGKEPGLHLKGIAREASRKVVGISRWVFDGGGNEPPARCGRSAKGVGGGAGRDGRCRCEGGDQGTTWEEEGGGGWKVTATVKLPSSELQEPPEPPKPLDSYTHAAIGGGMSLTKTLEEGVMDDEVDLRPPPKPLDSDSNSATSMAAELPSEMKVVEQSPISSCARQEKVGGTGLTFQMLGPTFTLMGQAQYGYSTQVLTRKAKETWMSPFFNSLGQTHISDREDQGWEGVIGFTKFSACVIESARPSLTVFLSQQGRKINHHPGRNIIENLTVLRFANLVLEPHWSWTYIHIIQVILFRVIQKKIAQQGELTCKLTGPIAVYQFYHYPDEEFGECLWYFMVNVRDQVIGDWKEITHLPEGITELLPLLSDFLLFVEWLACHPDLITGNDVEGNQTTLRSKFWNYLDKVQMKKNWDSYDRSSIMKLRGKTQVGICRKKLDVACHKKKAVTKYSKRDEFEAEKKNIETQLEQIKRSVLVIWVLAHTKIRKMKGLKQNKIHLMEVQFMGEMVAQRVDYAINSFEKLNPIDVVFLQKDNVATNISDALLVFAQSLLQNEDHSQIQHALGGLTASLSAKHHEMLAVGIRSDLWDPGGHSYATSTLPSIFVKIWDPGGSPLFFSIMIFL